MALVPLALAASSACMAQSAVALPGVTVTARRVAQDLQSAPFSGVVLTGEQIIASGASDANDAIRRLVGIPSRTDLRGGRNYTLDLQGYGATADQNVVVVVDGVRISENELATARLSALSPEMIESIEIIRGGSSVQWGEGASAGIINVTLKRAGRAGFSGSASAQVESYAGRDLRAQLNGGAGNIGFDVNARSYRTDGYRANGADRQETISAGLNGDAGGLGFRARISHDEEKSRFPGPLSFAQFAANPRQSVTPNDFGNYSETRVTAGADYKLDAWTLTVDVGHRDRDSSGAFGTYSATSKSRMNQISPKAAYNSRMGDAAVTLLAGLDFNDWDFDGVDTFGQNENSHQRNRALYLTGDVLLATGTRLAAGVRSEKVNKRGMDPANFVNYDRNNHLNAWDLGVNQALAPGFNVYGRAAKSYRLPNVDENRFLFTALRPQNTRDIEAGLKWQAAAGHTAGVRLFRQTAVDEIAYDPTLFSNVNLDPTRRTGIEITGRAQLAKNLALTGTLQTVQAKFSSGPNSGKEIPLVSSQSGTLRMDWRIDERQSLDFGVRYLGSARFGDDNANTCAREIPSSTLLDARYAWKFDKVEVSLAADNLANHKGYSQAFSCLTGAVYPDPGRVLKAAVRYVF
ncbi:MAG: TonB-dependent receptor [Burkholderiaceae bacterium]|nr:TonB-dependent receptor [Burkholderiaceae bacterium]